MSKKRTPSSARWLAEHESDAYVRKARAEGYRSRAVYKLAEMDARDRLFRPGITVVDLGAAPGGWSQYAARRVGPTGCVMAFDVLPMEPIAGVEVLQGDFREPTALERLDAALQGRPVDLVLADMAPNISGVAAADQAQAIHLAELAVDFCAGRLRPGGTLVVKAFQGEGYDDFLRALRARFERVAIRKPKASRPRSREVYLVARNQRVV